MILEYAPNFILFDYIAFSGHFSEDLARFYFCQIIDALEHIHQAGVAHRDIKLENILLDSDYNIKIADFGLSTPISRRNDQAGTQSYMAPEIFLANDYSSKDVDLFSSAIILFIMVAGHPPFKYALPQDPHYKPLVLENDV